MKLCALYDQDQLDNLEYNHRKFCENNKIEYLKFRVNDVGHKYYMIHQLLQQNLDETLIFIDSHSYFRTFNFKFNLDRDVWVQAFDDKLGKDSRKIKLDNFIIVRSNPITVKIFKKILEHVMSLMLEGNPTPNIPYPEQWTLPYPFKQNNLYLNINAKYHDNSLTSEDVLVNYIDYKIGACHAPSLANLLCNHTNATYNFSTDEFSVVNPGKEQALVMLYTDHIKKYGAISEQNITRYCNQNNITLYIYRAIPKDLGNINGTWTKPYLLLRHMNDHQHIAWIDSDILICKNYRFDWSKEICLYSDPISWEFNAGYICIKNTEKNKNLLTGTIEHFSKLGNLDSVYAHGGDQTYLIKTVQEMYPDFVSVSNDYGNSHLFVPKLRMPTDPVMIHFMGFDYQIRTALMDYYEQKIAQQK